MSEKRLITGEERCRHHGWAVTYKKSSPVCSLAGEIQTLPELNLGSRLQPDVLQRFLSGKKQHLYARRSSWPLLFGHNFCFKSSISVGIVDAEFFAARAPASWAHWQLSAWRRGRKLWQNVVSFCSKGQFSTSAKRWTHLNRHQTYSGDPLCWGMGGSLAPPPTGSICVASLPPLTFRFAFSFKGE